MLQEKLVYILELFYSVISFFIVLGCTLVWLKYEIHRLGKIDKVYIKHTLTNYNSFLKVFIGDAVKLLN